MGQTQARLRIGHVSALRVPIPLSHTELRDFLMVDTALLPGMSGGPLFDIEGRLVGIVQISSYVESGAANMAVVMAATRAYWN